MNDQSTWSAYADTRVTIEAPDGRLIVTPADEGDAVIDEVWHVITAYNPRSVKLTSDENHRRHDQLLRALRDEGWMVVPAVGQGVDGSWPPEESVAVGDIDSAAAVELGRRFEQLAIFRIGPDRVDVIDCSTADIRSSRPFRVAAGDAL